MQFFPRGACKEGSACKFLHEKDTDVPMRQANSSKDRDGEEPIRQVFFIAWLLFLYIIQM